MGGFCGGPFGHLRGVISHEQSLVGRVQGRDGGIAAEVLQGRSCEAKKRHFEAGYLSEMF